MSRAPRAALAVVLALAAAPAAGFVRTTDKVTGQPLSWPLPAVPWHLNRAWPDSAPSCQVSAAGDPALDAVRASFAQWEQSCTDLRLLYAGESSTLQVGAADPGENVVLFRRGWCSQNPNVVDPISHAIKDPCFTNPDGGCSAIYDCFQDHDTCVGRTSCLDWAIVALTSVLYDPSNGRIMSADVEVNGWDGLAAGSAIGNSQHGWYFTCYPGAQPALCKNYGDPDCGYMDLQNAVTHEAGHFLGLAHPCGEPGLPGCPPNDDRTMAPTAAPGETKKRTLSDDDLAGICAIYPSSSGGCGCGAGQAGGAGALLLAALALRPRARRRGAASVT